MYDQILNRLSQFISLDRDERDIFVSKLKLRTYKKKEVILHEGDVCLYAYFINRGCLRYYYNVGDQENTAQFFFENGWYTDYDSFLTGKPLTTEHRNPRKIRTSATFLRVICNSFT